MQLPKILLIDSDIHFLGALQDGLGQRFRTKAVGSFELAVEILGHMSFDAIVMELVLGQQQGMNLLKTLNQRKYRPPIIVMTNHATKEMVIESLHLKVQRFFEKPMPFEKIKLAIEECLHENSEIPESNEVEIAPGIHLNFQLQAVIQDDKEVPLTATEFEILKTLWAHRNQKILRQEIIEKIWAQRNISSNNFDTQFSNLKKKVPALRDQLTVIRGKGYIYSDT